MEVALNYIFGDLVTPKYPLLQILNCEKFASNHLLQVSGVNTLALSCRQFH